MNGCQPPPTRQPIYVPYIPVPTELHNIQNELPSFDDDSLPICDENVEIEPLGFGFYFTQVG